MSAVPIRAWDENGLVIVKVIEVLLQKEERLRWAAVILSGKIIGNGVKVGVG